MRSTNRDRWIAAVNVPFDPNHNASALAEIAQQSQRGEGWPSPGPSRGHATQAIRQVPRLTEEHRSRSLRRQVASPGWGGTRPISSPPSRSAELVTLSQVPAAERSRAASGNVGAHQTRCSLGSGSCAPCVSFVPQSEASRGRHEAVRAGAGTMLPDGTIYANSTVKFTGTFRGCGTGSVAMRSTGLNLARVTSGEVVLVDNSGTGELVAMRGTGRIVDGRAAPTGGTRAAASARWSCTASAPERHPWPAWSTRRRTPRRAVAIGSPTCRASSTSSRHIREMPDVPRTIRGPR